MNWTIEEAWHVPAPSDIPALFVRTPGTMFREVGRFLSFTEAVTEADSRRELRVDGEHARYRVAYVSVEKGTEDES